MAKAVAIYLATSALLACLLILAYIVRVNHDAIARAEHNLGLIMRAQDKECRDLDNLKEVTLQALFAAQARARASLPKDSPILAKSLRELDREIHALQRPTC